MEEIIEVKEWDIVNGYLRLYDKNGNDVTGKRAHYEGDFDCSDNNLTSLIIPEGFTCGGGFDCRYNKLTSLVIPEGFTCGGDFDCSDNNLTSLIISEGFTCRRSFDCRYNKLTSLTIPEGFTCGGSFYCFRNNLISLIIPEGFTCGGDFDCSDNNLTSLIISEGFTCGGDFYCRYNNLTNFTPPEPATFNDFLKKGFVYADEILTKLISKKGNVFRTQRIGKDEIIYVVKSGKFFAHGETIKEAKGSLLFKMADRDLSAYESLAMETEKTPIEWAAIYSAITGACETGCRMFIESKGKLKKTYTLKEILEETKGAYEYQAFERFFKQ